MATPRSGEHFTSTILRNGNVIKSCDTVDVTINELAQLMVGRAIDNKIKLSEPRQARVLDIKNISYANPDIYGTSLKEIKFNVNFGEIFGIGGISGNGQTELMKVLSGEVGLNDGNQIFYHNVYDKYLEKDGAPALMDAMAMPGYTETTAAGTGFGLGFSVSYNPALSKQIDSKGSFRWGGAASTTFFCDPYFSFV